MKPRYRTARTAISLILSIGLLLPSCLPSAFAAEEQSGATQTASSELTAPIAIDEFFKKATELVHDFYPRAKVVTDKTSMHFEFKVKSEVSHYTHKSELVPQFGGIAGDLTLKAGEYNGPDKGRLPSESIDGFHTILTVAPFSKKTNSHLLLKLNFPADASADFKDRFKDLMKEFNAGDEPPPPVATTTPSSTASSTTTTPADPAKPAETTTPPMSNSALAAAEHDEKKLVILNFINGIYAAWDTLLVDAILKSLSGETDDEIKKYSQSPQLTPIQRVQYKQAFLQVCAKKRARLKELFAEEGIDLTDMILDLSVDIIDSFGFKIEDYRDFAELGKMIDHAKEHLNFPKSTETEDWKKWGDQLTKKFEPLASTYDKPYDEVSIEIGILDKPTTKAATITAVIPPSPVVNTPEELAEKKQLIDKLISTFDPKWDAGLIDIYLNEEVKSKEKEIDKNTKLSSAQKLQQKKVFAKKVSDATPKFKEALKAKNFEPKEHSLSFIVQILDALCAWNIDDYRKLENFIHLIKHAKEILPPADDSETSKAAWTALTEKVKNRTVRSMEMYIVKLKPIIVKVAEEESAGKFKVALPKVAAPAVKKGPVKKKKGK